MSDKFYQRKNSILSKLDKSSIGKWDKKIIGLCEKINSFENYYTTSSCAGRVVLIINQDKKESDLFLKVYHDLISFEELKKNLIELTKKNLSIKFKQESAIIHVACKNLKDAQRLYDKAKKVGWKKSGLISWEKNFILELHSTEKLEFPIIDQKILVDDSFLKKIIKESNKNLKKGCNKIEKLKKLI